MITQEDAQERCLAFLNDYLKAAAPCSAEDIANLLMKLISAAGLTMYEVVGQEETMGRMIRTAAFCCRLPAPNEVVIERREKPQTKH